MPPLDIAGPALARILEEGESAEHVVRATLRANPSLDNDGRRELADLLFGACVQRARLAYGLRAAGAPLHARSFAALYLRLFRSAPGGADDPLLAAAATAPLPTDPRERLVIERSLPAWLANELITALGLEGADRFLAAVNSPGPVVARANLLRASRPELLEALRREDHAAQAGSLSPWSVTFDARPNVRGSPAWRAGLFEVQDEGSQLIAHATGAAPGETVVDLCAGRGGKTLALAAMMEDRGVLHALDVDESRLRDLAPRLHRAGVTCVRPATLPGSGRANDALAERADVVLVDAPCSELGTLRRSPDLRWRITPATLSEQPARQAAILDEGARLVRPGGRLVYATCTVRPAENEEVVQAFLARTTSFALSSERQLLPHREDTDGFYFACLRRVPV